MTWRSAPRWRPDRRQGSSRWRAAVAVASAGLGPQQIALDQRLAERDRRRLEHAATGTAGRVVLAGTDPVEGPFHRRPLAALQAGDVPDRSVDLHDPLGAVTGLEVQAVDVLRDQHDELVPALQLDQGSVPGI